MTKCTSKAKSTGRQCQRDAMINGKCQVHGGKTPKGVASPHFKTGRYSKHLPTRMMADYKASLADPELLNLRAEIAITDARINDLLKRVNSGESGEVWRQLRETYDLFRGAVGNTALATQYLDEINSLIKRGNSDAAIWRELNSNLEQRRRLVDSEAKRMKDMHQMVRSDEFALFVKAYMEALVENVKDKDDLRAVVTRLDALSSASVS